jgi:hypothetical protein
MTLEHKIEDGVAWVRAYGVLRDAEILEQVERLVADPAYEAVDRDLFDASEVTSLELTTAGVRAAADILRAAPRPSTRVAIVTGTIAAFGMGRMYELMREDIEVMVFTDRGDAAGWLLASPTLPATDAPAGRGAG